MRFKAIIGLNFRDVHTSSPKVLLREIRRVGTAPIKGTEVFRDHCWVSLTKDIEEILPTTNKKSLIIEFTANTKAYKTHENKPTQETLTKIRNVTVIRKVK